MVATTNTTISSITPLTTSCAEDALGKMDVTEKVFEQFLIKRDARSIQALGCTNREISENIDTLKLEKRLVDTSYLENRFPDVRVLDTNILPGLQFDEKFHVNLFSIVKGCEDLPPHIEGEAGVSILIMRKGTNYSKFIDYTWELSAEEMMEIEIFPPRMLTKLDEEEIQETYAVLITNNVFTGSRDKKYRLQSELVQSKYHCELPSGLEYLGIIALTQKVFSVSLYGNEPNFTYGRSSTFFEGYPLVIGTPLGKINIDRNFKCGDQIWGAGGQRKV